MGEDQGKDQQSGWWESIIPSSQEEQADEAFLQALAEVAQSPDLIFVGNFNLSNVCWKYNITERMQSRRFLKSVDDNFLTQMVNEPTRGGALLD